MSVLGIDIGIHHIKVVEAKQNKKNTPIKAYLLDTPLGAVQGGEIKDVQAIGALLRALIAKHDIRAKELYFAINSPKMLNRDISLPPMKAEEVEAAVDFDISQSFPGILQTHFISYLLYSKLKQPLNGVAVFCPSRIVESYQQLAVQIGVPIARIDAGFNAATRALYQFTQPDKNEETVMLADIDVESAQITLIARGKILFSRHTELTLPQISEAEATEEQFAEILKQKHMAVLEQIRQTLDFYHFNNKQSDNVAKIFLTGESSRETGLADYLANALAVPVQNVGSLVKNLDDLQGDLYLSAAGALLQSKQFTVDINLLPLQGNKEGQRSKAKYQAIAFATVGGFLLVFALCYGLLLFGSMTETNRKADLQAEMKTYSALDEVKLATTAAKNRTASIQQVSQTAEAQSLMNIKLLNNLAKVMPEGIFVQTFSVDSGNRIALLGSAQTRKDIAEFVNRLRSIPGFTEISVGSINTSQFADGTIKDFSFNMNITMDRQVTGE
ncbi:MAG: pilus assembly protein PilM [Clostridia bacterium]